MSNFKCQMTNQCQMTNAKKNYFFKITEKINNNS